MKKVTLFILFLGTVSAYAQSFKLYEVVDEAQGNEISNGSILTDTCEAYDGEVCGSVEAILENTASVSKMVVCKREIIGDMPAEYENFCWSNCWSPNVFIDTVLVRSDSVYRFVTHYAAPIVAGSHQVRYVFYDADKREDSISLICEYLTLPGTSVPLIVVNNLFSVYPNPTSNQLTIDNGQLTMDDVEIYNVVGQRLNNYQLSTVNSQLTIDVSHLANGMYYLKIGNQVTKFIKE